MISFTKILVLLASSAVAGAVNFGTYGTLAKKRGWSPWKAGAVTGIVTGLSAVALTMLFRSTSMGLLTTQPVGLLTAQELNGLQIHQLPASVGMLTAQQLNGVYAQYV